MGERASVDGSRPEAPIGGRLLEGGARGVGRIAGATGLDRTLEVAVEEAIVRAVESAAVEAAITRLIENGSLARAIEDAIDGDRLEETISRAIDSEVADRIWEDLLASDKAQMLVERIAEAPEIRVAVAAQGVGLLGDLGRQVARASTIVDSFIERVARRVLRRPQRVGTTDHAGLCTRGVGFAVDAGVLSVGFALFTTLLAAAVSLVTNVDTISPLFAGALSFGALIVNATYFLGFWAFEGQTPGMRFLGIRLEHEGDQRIGLRRAFKRLWGLILAVLPFGLGLVPIAFNERRRGLQDRIADTDVVRRSNRVLAPWAENRHMDVPA